MCAFLLFLSVFQVFCKVYFLQKYNKYIYRQKKMLVLKRNNILSDVETCHSASRLRPAAPLPSSFVPLNWLSERENPTTSLPILIRYVPLAWLIKSDKICKLRILMFVLNSSEYSLPLNKFPWMYAVHFTSSTFSFSFLHCSLWFLLTQFWGCIFVPYNAWQVF